MHGLPIILHVTGKTALIVGGGGVALRRARALIDAGAAVRVVAPEVDPAIPGLGVTIQPRRYETGDLDGVFLVVIATDNPAVNDAVAADAARLRILINRADDPAAGDLSIPAHARHGRITIAVDTAGASPSASATIRQELSVALDPIWPAALEIAAQYRQRIQEAFPDPGMRGNRLRALTDAYAIQVFRQGGREALERHYETLLASTADLAESP